MEITLPLIQKITIIMLNRQDEMMRRVALYLQRQGRRFKMEIKSLWNFIFYLIFCETSALICFYLIFCKSPHANILYTYYQDKDLQFLCLGPQSILYLYLSKAASKLHQNPKILNILKFHSSSRDKIF